MAGKTRIKIAGHLDKKWEDWFEGLAIRYEDNSTILSGTIKDDSCLYGIINKLRDLNLKLISLATSEK